MELEYFAHAHGNNFTDLCNEETGLNLDIITITI